ncbi:MAG: efflux RND transporter periplasmic adaptor subunit [Bdellovibrionota bacterium]
MKLSAKKAGLAGAAVLVVAVIFLGTIGKPRNAAKLGTVVRQDLVQKVTIAGTVISRRRTVVAAPYNGYVRQLFVKVGDKVKPGQPLVSVAQSLQSSEPVFPLRAPYAGTVMHVNKHEGEYVKEGDSVDYILRIDDLEQLFVQANAPEMDWAKLKTGLEATMKASAITSRSYKGRIAELTLAPQPSQSGSGGGGGNIRCASKSSTPTSSSAPA